MIKEISIKNLGPISNIRIDDLSAINLIIGPNQSGKTFLLKSLFAALKTVEQYKRGRENRLDKEILSDKLYWTFQSSALGNIVRKGESMMSFTMISDEDEQLKYSFGPSTSKQANIDINTFKSRTSNTVFIPAKEILSIRNIIIEAKEDNQFGFEEPYSDLAKALGRTQKDRNETSYAKARDIVSSMVGGRLEYDEEKKEWQFRGNDRKIYEVSATSEGVKKLSILDILLGNRYLDNNSVVIIDELEANLHPSMIAKFLDAIFMLAESGIQFFISSHSYFVIKRLYIMAHRKNYGVPVLSFDNGICSVSNLRDEMPQNPIIGESIALYKDEISL